MLRIHLGWALLAAAMCGPLLGAEPPTTDDTGARSAAVALNYSRAALHRIRTQPSLRVLAEEQDKILNQLDLNGVADEEVLKLYSGVLDEVHQVQVAELERDVIHERYRRAARREFGLTAFTLAAQVASTQFVSAVRTGANSWWDYRNTAYNRESDLWKVDKARMQSIFDKSTLFLDTSWKMARARRIPDRWLVRNDDFDRLETAMRETDLNVRLRVLKRMEPFMECYPPYWYYVARTHQASGRLAEAAGLYERAASLGQGHFRKDEMLATALANRAVIQSFLADPHAPETALAALQHSTDAWEANLLCANVLLAADRIDAAEDAILRNLDVNLERSSSQLSLLGLYYRTDRKTRLAACLANPDFLRDVPLPVLAACAARLGDATPNAAVELLANSIHANLAGSFGRERWTVTANSQWRLAEAQVAATCGRKSLSAGKLTIAKDALLLPFESLDVETVSSTGDANELRVTLTYPSLEPIGLTLLPATSTRAGETASSGFPLKRGPVYRLAGVSQHDRALSLLPRSPSTKSGSPRVQGDGVSTFALSDDGDVEVRPAPSLNSR